MSFVIKSEETRKVAGGKIVVEEFHYVIEETTGALVGTKSHKTLELAQVELDSLAGLAEGMEFAIAKFPTMSDKARVGKANVVSEFLAWIAAGKPVTDASEEVAEEETAESGETF